MRFRSLLATAILVLLVLFFSACSDDNPTSPEPISDILVTIEFENILFGGLPSEGVVFASDRAGNVLDISGWSSTSTVVLKNSEVHPDSISFTIVTQNGGHLSLDTRFGVPVESVQYFKGHGRPPMSGNAEISFTNVPDCWQHRMAYNFTSVHGWSEFRPMRSIEIFGESTDFFVRVDPLDKAPVGGWLRDVRAGDTPLIDFANPADVSPLQASVVQIPRDGYFVLCEVTSVLETDPVPLNFRLDQVHIDEALPESITIYTPEVDPSSLVTMYYEGEAGNSDTFFWQEATGPIPTSFTNLTGELLVTSTATDSFTFTTDIAWDKLVAAWVQNEELTSSYWQIEGPGPTQSFVLPQFPGDFAHRFPAYPREKYTLTFVEIYQNTNESLVRSQGKQLGRSKNLGPHLAKFTDSVFR